MWYLVSVQIFGDNMIAVCYMAGNQQLRPFWVKFMTVHFNFCRHAPP